MEPRNTKKQALRLEELQDIKYDLDEAWRYWQGMISYYNMVSEPELVDFAIFEISAAERRHSYLYKKYCELAQRNI